VKTIPAFTTTKKINSSLREMDPFPSTPTSKKRFFLI